MIVIISFSTKDYPLPINAPLLIVLSELFLVISGMVIKHVADQVPISQIVLFRNLFALVLLVPWLLSANLGVLKTQRLGLHILRACFGIVGMGCMYYAWAYLPLAQSALIKQTAPFFVPLIAFFWLSEKVPKVVIFSIFIGFSGVYFILNPQDGELNSLVLIALCGAILGAFAKVTVRKMSSTEGARIIVFYFCFFGTLIAAIPAIYFWQPMSITAFIWLFVLAATSTIAQLMLNKAYGLAKAASLAPFTYSSVFYAAVFGWLFWAESIGQQTLIGMVLILAAGVLSYRANNKALRAEQGCI